MKRQERPIKNTFTTQHQDMCSIETEEFWSLDIHSHKAAK